MNYRDWLQQLIYKIINPVVHGMIKVGITPNFITTTDRKSTRLNSSHQPQSRMPSSA